MATINELQRTDGFTTDDARILVDDPIPQGEYQLTLRVHDDSGAPSAETTVTLVIGDVTVRLTVVSDGTPVAPRADGRILLPRGTRVELSGDGSLGIDGNPVERYQWLLRRV